MRLSSIGLVAMALISAVACDTPPSHDVTLSVTGSGPACDLGSITVDAGGLRFRNYESAKLPWKETLSVPGRHQRVSVSIFTHRPNEKVGSCPQVECAITSHGLSAQAIGKDGFVSCELDLSTAK